MIKIFNSRKYSVRDMLKAEMEELQRLVYKEDQRRDYHAAQVVYMQDRIEKIKEKLDDIAAETGEAA